MKKIVILWIIFFLVFTVIPINLEGEIDGNERSVKSGSRGLTSHPPIYIDGNDNFTSANGVVSGSGTESGPYIIEGWDIDASSANGIYIQNTDVYFIIRNCTIHDGYGNSYYGISFSNVQNGKIENCTIYNNKYGIYLESSLNNNIGANQINKNSRGIFLYSSSSNNNITGNRIYSNYMYGIVLCASSLLYNSPSKNNISANQIYNNHYGIYSDSYSNNNNISANQIHDNSHEGIHLSSYSNNNNISANHIYNNTQYGIYLYFSSNNEIHYNNIYSNTDYGVYNYNSEVKYQANAIYNWWGSANGPGMDGANPVSGAVLYNPWLTSPVAFNQPPTAYIDSITLNPATQGQTVSFVGQGTDTDGTITAYNWRSSIDGQLSTSASFSTSTLSAGEHTIYFKVQDNNGSWSSEVSETLIINPSGGLTSHTPISIYGNSQFTSANGVVSGSGTESDPYIIENWDIDASSASTAGIDIRNTNVYFIIRNCIIHDGGSKYWGIYFFSVQNGEIKNVTSYNNSYGIWLYYSSDNNQITNCAVYNNYRGIWLDSSSNNQIINCPVYNNSLNGVRLYSSSNNIILNCNISNNGVGITQYHSSNNIMVNCTINNNSGIGIYLHDSSHNNIENCTIYNHSECGIDMNVCTNTNVKKCIIYNNSLYGIWLSSDSNNNAIRHCKLYNHYRNGILLYYSSTNQITNCTIHNNRDGIYIEFSSDEQITNCTIHNNSRYGMGISSSPNNKLRNNYLNDNLYNFAIFAWQRMYTGSYAEFYQDIDVSNKVNGRKIYYIIEQSDLFFNHTVNIGYLGLVLCKNILVENLNLHNNVQGILVCDSPHTTIRNCLLYNNSKGVEIRYSLDDSITNCSIYNNGEGIYLGRCLNTSITNCVLYNNSCGIELGYTSENNIITNCVLHDNSKGIYIYISSKENMVTNCTIYNNSGYGIYLYHSSDNNQITNCVFCLNGVGVCLNSSSNNNYIDHNNFINNTYQANDSCINFWDNGNMGNYWSDYSGLDLDSNWIGDTPYNISGGNNQDKYPLMRSIDNAGCILNISPIALFTYSLDSPNTEDIIQFTDLSFDISGDIVSWYWNFGDGNTSTEQNPQHKYSAAGNYIVKLTVTDNNGLNATCTKLITVKEEEAVTDDGTPNDGTTDDEQQLDDEENKYEINLNYVIGIVTVIAVCIIIGVVLVKRRGKQTAKVKEEKKTTQMLRCPKCRQTFRVELKPKPFNVKCLHCGKEGVLR